MSLFSSTDVGRIVKVTGGILSGKYAMVVKEYKEGVGVITDPTDWPSSVPIEYNALFVPEKHIGDITEEEQTLLRTKFPHPDQFK